MSQKSTYGIPRGSPMEKENLQPITHYDYGKKGSATTYGTLDDERLKKGLQTFLEDLDRQGKLDGALEEIRSKKEAPAATGTK